MKVICLGDSLTACGGPGGRYSDILQDRFPEHEFINLGRGGDAFTDARERLPEVIDAIDSQPSVTLLELGACDWWRDERPPEAWASDLADFICRLQNAGGSRVIVLGVFGDYLGPDGQRHPKVYGTDERALRYRDLEAATAARFDCDYIPNIQETIIDDRCCWRDRNHPNEYGNRRVANVIEPVLERYLGPARPVRRRCPETTREFWHEAVALRPDHPAVRDGERCLTYLEADIQITKLAAGLGELAGARPTVAVYLPNCLEYYLLYWAVVQLGGVIVPLNTWLSEDNVGSIFARVRPDLLVVKSPRDKRVLAASRQAPPRAVVHLEDTPADAVAWGTLFENEGEMPPAAVAPDDLSIIMHTSGTTAAPKGAMMRHSDLVFNVMAAINAHQFSRDDVHLLVNPMFHCTALYSQLPLAAYQKSTLVITADTAPEPLMDLVVREGITTLLSIPTICQRITALPDPGRFAGHRLRLIAYAGSMMPVTVIRALQRLFPDVELHNFFGLTETISMTHVLNGADAEERPDSIGRLLPFVEAIVVDEQGRRCQPGEVGELLFAREEVIPGYFGEPERLSESLTELEGRIWFRTGDLASIDEEGYFFLRGRQKDMIIVGGENVFASEVEAVLMSLDGVREAAVIGVPATGVREALGEVVKVFVVREDPALTEQDVRRHCHHRLASFKIPVHVVFRDALPRNPSGKVVKAELA